MPDTVTTIDPDTVTTIDPEIVAIRDVLTTLAALPPDARRRVLAYVVARLGYATFDEAHDLVGAVDREIAP